MTNSYAFLGSQRDKAKRARNVIDAAVDNRRRGKKSMDVKLAKRNLICGGDVFPLLLPPWRTHA